MAMKLLWRHGGLLICFLLTMNEGRGSALNESGNTSLEDAIKILQLFERAMQIREQLPSKRSCPVTNSEGITDTDRDVVEILRSLLTIKSKIEQICRQIETFRTDFFDTVSFVVKVRTEDFSPSLCSKIEVIERDLAAHEARVCLLLKELEQTATSKKSLQEGNLATFEEAIRAQNAKILVLILSITATLLDQQQALNEKLRALQASLEGSIAEKLNDVIALLQERTTQTLIALAQLETALKDQIVQLGIQAAEIQASLQHLFDERLSSLQGAATSQAAMLLEQLQKTAQVLSKSLKDTCAQFAGSLAAQQKAICVQTEQTRTQAFVQKAEEQSQLDAIKNTLSDQHTKLKQDAVNLGVTQTRRLNQLNNEFCSCFVSQTSLLSAGLEKLESDVLGRIKLKFPAMSGVVDQHTQQGLKDLACFEVGLIRSLGRNFCSLDEKIAIALGDICAQLVQLDGDVASQSGKMNRILARIDANLSSKVCVKMSGIEKNQVVGRNDLANQISDFQAEAGAIICSAIAESQLSLAAQDDALKVQCAQVNAALTSDLNRQFKALDSVLSGYQGIICSKLASLESSVGSEVSEQISHVQADLLVKINGLCEKVSRLKADTSSVISQEFSELSSNIARNGATACGKIADFRADAISRVNALCEKFSDVKADTVIAISQKEEAIIEKLARLDTILTQIAITFTVLARLTTALQPGIALTVI